MYYIIDGQYVCKDTNTKGPRAYVVAMACGGVMEDPDIHYENHQIIRASSRREAEERYNRINACSYYYGSVLMEIEEPLC